VTYVNCLYCKAPLDPDGPNVLRKVHAWEHKSQAASRRSGSDLVLREVYKPEVWACSGCVRKLRRGVALEQTSFLGDAAA